MKVVDVFCVSSHLIPSMVWRPISSVSVPLTLIVSSEFSTRLLSRLNRFAKTSRTNSVSVSCKARSLYRLLGWCDGEYLSFALAETFSGPSRYCGQPRSIQSAIELI